MEIRTCTKSYVSALNERLTNYGVRIEQTGDRLAAFYEVTNTYLMVFGAFGALGMIIGIAGLGFVLLRNFNYRRKEFALMMSTGYTVRKIRNMIFSDHMLIMLAGIVSGFVPALIATFPSLEEQSGRSLALSGINDHCNNSSRICSSFYFTQSCNR